jgi:hypothetical protein
MLRDAGEVMNWAYQFFYEKRIEEMEKLFNQWGPWEWSLGDSHWYGDYLCCAPFSDVRIRIHEWGYKPGEARRYSSLMQILHRPSVSRSGASRATIDPVFFELLGRLPAQSVVEIEWYD